jgi:hypothetical protein
VLGYNSTYFSNKIQKGKTCYSEEQVISMLEFLIDNIFVYKSKNDADEAVSVVSLTSSSGGYINGRNSANLELLIYKTSSIYLYVKLKALASIPLRPHHLWTYTSNLTTVVKSVLKFMMNGTTSILKS